MWVKLMVTSCLAMTIGLYLLCSLVYPNHLICLYHFDHNVSSDLAVTTTSLRALGIALCQFSCMVMVPYEWVWIMGSCLLSSNLRLFHNKLVEGVRIPFFSSLVLNPHRSSKMWIEPFACLVFIALLIPFRRFPLLLWRADKMKVNPVPPHLVLSCLSPYMLVPI
jgi:hypothetical protein